MRVTRVWINKLENAGAVVATADIVLDEEICVNEIQIINGSKGLNIAFPFKNDKKKEGRYLDIAHPITNELREKIQKAIIEEYKIATKG